MGFVLIQTEFGVSQSRKVAGLQILHQDLLYLW